MLVRNSFWEKGKTKYYSPLRNLEKSAKCLLLSRDFHIAARIQHLKHEFRILLQLGKLRSFP